MARSVGFKWVCLFLQPTEFAKIVAILVLARYFEQAQFQPRDLRWAFGGFMWAFGLIILDLAAAQPEQCCGVDGDLCGNVVDQWRGVKAGAMLWRRLVGGSLMACRFLIAFPFLATISTGACIVHLSFPDPNATYGATYNVRAGVDCDWVRGIIWQRIRPWHTNTIALSQSASYRFYLFGGFRRVWHDWRRSLLFLHWLLLSGVVFVRRKRRGMSLVR